MMKKKKRSKTQANSQSSASRASFKKKKFPESTRRILDMLAGWFLFSDKYSEKKIKKETHILMDLYQDAGNFETDKEVKQFIEKTIIPFLIKGKV